MIEEIEFSFNHVSSSRDFEPLKVQSPIAVPSATGIYLTELRIKTPSSSDVAIRMLSGVNEKDDVSFSLFSKQEVIMKREDGEPIAVFFDGMRIEICTASPKSRVTGTGKIIINRIESEVQ